ncbi:phasin family protein [Modicisalibacter tunisiensis]|uniref:phasin family protein n=1 Tax=Modicisalibacter tunisiensis TaxID=390637 RepID=UPI001CCB1B4C|nr:phasin family protein [Modicisalibacter tunisiensis]MBZ9537560.1 phasin family protein [Modicisalibacter tunisiensis]
MPQDPMFDAFTDQTQRLFEPMRKLNGLMLNNLERLTQQQLESMKRYTQMGTERMRAAADVQNADDMRDFAARQAELMNELSRQMIEDARAMTELSLAFRSQLESAFGELSAAATEAADQATQTAEKAAGQATPAAEKTTGQVAGQSTGASATAGKEKEKDSAQPARSSSQASRGKSS